MHGTFVWNELASTDVERARAFYDRRAPELDLVPVRVHQAAGPSEPGGADEDAFDRPGR